MIGSFVLLAGALLLASPDARPWPRPHPRLQLDLRDLDFKFPDLDVHVRVPDLHFDMRGMDGLFAMNADDPDDEDEDEDRDSVSRNREQRARDREQRDRQREQRDREREQRDREREQRVREREQRRREFRFRFHSNDDEEESGDEKPSSRTSGTNGAAAMPVKGPVTFRLHVQSGEVEVVSADKPQIAISVSGVPVTGEVKLMQYGDRVEAEFGGHRQLRRGRLRVELPRGSSVDFGSTSGDISVQNVGGDVRVRTMSGDVKVSGARKADVESISGDVSVSSSGPSLRLHTVSGNAVATTTDPAVQLQFESASGNLEWAGACAKGCHLSAETVSGEINLQPDPAKSSFELSYASHSGDFRNDLQLQVKRSPKRKHDGMMGGWLEAVYGKGEGVIECDAFSGDLTLRKKQ